MAQALGACARFPNPVAGNSHCYGSPRLDVVSASVGYVQRKLSGEKWHSRGLDAPFLSLMNGIGGDANMPLTAVDSKRVVRGHFRDGELAFWKGISIWQGSD